MHVACALAHRGTCRGARRDCRQHVAARTNGQGRMTTTKANPGASFPLGATLRDGGANFSVFSRTAGGIELLLFDRNDDARPARVIAIDPVEGRSYHYWHVFVPGV